MAIVFYSEMEEQVSSIIRNHFNKYTHTSVSCFINNTMNNMIGRISKSDISKLIDTFGREFKRKFNTSIDDRTVTIYSNIITARHNIGHKDGSQITMAEIRNGIDSAEKLLNNLASCLDEEINIDYSSLYTSKIRNVCISFDLAELD